MSFSGSTHPGVRDDFDIKALEWERDTQDLEERQTELALLERRRNHEQIRILQCDLSAVRKELAARKSEHLTTDDLEKQIHKQIVEESGGKEAEFCQGLKDLEETVKQIERSLQGSTDRHVQELAAERKAR